MPSDMISKTVEYIIVPWSKGKEVTTQQRTLAAQTAPEATNGLPAGTRQLETTGAWDRNLGLLGHSRRWLPLDQKSIVPLYPRSR